MKKFLFTIAFASMALSVFAQEHMTFKGVSIDGPREEFVSKLQKKNFVLKGTQDDLTILSGDFAGADNCIVGVSTLKGRDVVSSVSVIFPDKNNWKSLVEEYSFLKDLISEKYGIPGRSIEEFQNVKPKDDNARLGALQMDRCNWMTVFVTAKGTIELALSHDGIYRCFVILRYTDRINSEAVRAAAMQDL